MMWVFKTSPKSISLRRIIFHYSSTSLSKYIQEKQKIGSFFFWKSFLVLLAMVFLENGMGEDGGVGREVEAREKDGGGREGEFFHETGVPLNTA